MEWNNILKRNREYIKAKNKIKTQVENNRLQQLGLTENLQTLFKPILKSQEDIKNKLEAPKQQIQQSPPQIEYPIEDDGIVIRTLDDIKRYFSNPNPTLAKTIKPTIDQDGLILNGFRIRFNQLYPTFKIDRIDAVYDLTPGMINLLNGYDKDYNFKDLNSYVEILTSTRTGGPKTLRLRRLEKELDDNTDASDDNYTDDIIEEIDDFLGHTGDGVIFLSDNNEELLNRLQIILAAMKEGHQSHRQYNELNCILKRLLQKGIIDKNDYKSVIKNESTIRHHLK